MSMMKMTQVQVEAPHGLEGHTQQRAIEEELAIRDRAAGAEVRIFFIAFYLVSCSFCSLDQ